VVNFDVPHVPEDYIHRVGRTARAEAVGDAYTFVSPEEEDDLRAIERAIGRRLPRVTLPGFDYGARPAERFEVPLAERIAAIRARKAEERARAKAKAERRAQREAEEAERARARAEREASRGAGRPPQRGLRHERDGAWHGTSRGGERGAGRGDEARPPSQSGGGRRRRRPRRRGGGAG